MLAALISLSVARADVPAVETLAPGAFVVRAGGVSAQILTIATPAPVPGVGGICPFVLAASADGVALTRRPECPEALAPAVDAALAAWKVDVTGALAPIELSELWWTFTGSAITGPRLVVRPQGGRELVVHVPTVEVAPWWLSGQVPLEYPDAAIGKDTQSNTCRARIGTAADGFPEQVEISGCDPVFASALDEGLRRWRFSGTVGAGGTPVAAALTIEARYVYDGQVGDVEVLLPPPPDFGDRKVASQEPAKWTPPPPASGPPLFVVDHKSFAEVLVYEITWPVVAAAQVERRCEVLLQVNTARKVWAWSEACDESVRRATEEAAEKWRIAAGTIERGERMARFRGTFVFAPGASEPDLWLPLDDITSPVRDLPERVHTQRAARAVVTVPPKLPAKGLDGVSGEVSCEYLVTVDKRGRPRRITPAEPACPAPVAPYAEKALSRWRWQPAEADGQPIEATVHARVRVALP